VNQILSTISPEAFGFLLTLGLSLMIGFEREENRLKNLGGTFGGVRTFPLIGVSAYVLVTAFPDTKLPYVAGLLVLGTLLAISHHHSINVESWGITSEFAGVLTYALGAACAAQLYWLAVATAVATVILLQEKQRLKQLVTVVPRQELATLARFLVLSAVILPIVPDTTYTRFEINPFKMWLVVVAVSGVSYLSYLLQLRWRHRGILLAGVLGGAYSSTATTVVLARKSNQPKVPAQVYAGAIVAATGMMYLRLWILVMLFAAPLATPLTVPFLVMAALTTGFGWLLSRRTTATASSEPTEEGAAANPLELTSAFTFAALFTVVLVATRWVAERFGDTGVLILAAVMGAADVDPFILGLTQTAGGSVPMTVAAIAVLIAAGTNNLMKGVYTLVFGDHKVGVQVIVTLLIAALGSILLYLAVPG
jgi:uncharacterized membrane protein (DUF4010 family)